MFTWKTSLVERILLDYYNRTIIVRFIIYKSNYFQNGFRQCRNYWNFKL